MSADILLPEVGDCAALAFNFPSHAACFYLYLSFLLVSVWYFNKLLLLLIFLGQGFFFFCYAGGTCHINQARQPSNS